MQSPSVVLFQHDSSVAQALARNFAGHFKSVRVAGSEEELRQAIPVLEAGVVVMDIEGLKLSTVAQLHREFPKVSIVCTHRLADEAMWSAALNAGADDVLSTSDTQGIVHSTLQHGAHIRAAVA